MENSKRKIFIGGLPANITESQLKDYFIKYGNVSLHHCAGADLCIVYCNAFKHLNMLENYHC
jgi:RNA recognition motif-containing protein